SNPFETLLAAAQPRMMGELLPHLGGRGDRPDARIARQGALRDRSRALLETGAPFGLRPVLTSAVEGPGRPLDAGLLLALDRCQLLTKVVTLLAGREAGSELSVTATGSPSAQFASAVVTYGTIIAGAVPPEMAIGTSTAAPVSLMATMTSSPASPLYAETRTWSGEGPATCTAWKTSGRMYLLKLPMV